MDDSKDFELCKKLVSTTGLDEGLLLGLQPITNPAIYSKLMFEFGVVINYMERHVYIEYENGATSFAVEFEGISGIPRAIIECIAESN